VERRNGNHSVHLHISFPCCLHELLLGTVGAENVALVGDESLSDQGASAHGADETVVMPVAILERDEACTADAGDGLGASRASLGKEFAETVGAVRLLISGGESLSCQASVAIRATEALPMPRLIAICHATRLNDLVALDAPGGELLLVALRAVDIIIPWNE